MTPTTLPATDRNVPATEVPVRQTPPEIDPLREVVQGVEADCRLAPDEYLKEVRVPIGGE